MLLVEHKGDLNAINDDKKTPLSYGDNKLLKILDLSCGVTHSE